MLKTFLAGVAAAGAAGLYLIAYPLMTADKLRDAVEARDGAAVAAMVDFDSLRDDLEADLMAAMSGEDDDPMALAFGGAMVSGMINGFVRPEVVRSMVDGASSSRPRTGSSNTPSLPAVRDTSVHFGILEMTVRVQTDREPIDIVFAPRGLEWKVVGLDFDMDRLR